MAVLRSWGAVLVQYAQLRIVKLEDGGGWLADTAGIRELAAWNVPPDEVAECFVEFRPYLALCKFPDCSHTHEADCAVKDAVHWGQIHPGRYESYRKLYLQQPLPGD